jgi:hypothetical protein
MRAAPPCRHHQGILPNQQLFRAVLILRCRNRMHSLLTQPLRASHICIDYLPPQSIQPRVTTYLSTFSFILSHNCSQLAQSLPLSKASKASSVLLKTIPYLSSRCL